MPISILRYRDLKARKIVENRAQLRNLIEKHNFPRGRYLSPNVRGWTDPEVDQWVESRPVVEKGAMPLKGAARAKVAAKAAKDKAAEADRAEREAAESDQQQSA
jgi:predicted DNA-binding transcriptional regulator AlpA